MIPEVKTALNAFRDAGLLAAGQDFDFGGMQLPCVVEKAGFAYFKGANVGTASIRFNDRQREYLAEMRHAGTNRVVCQTDAGRRFFGTMCLSEPQAGSSCPISLPVPSAGRWQFRPTGNKMWISAGEHELSENIIHLVLAKVPDENGKLIPGVKGISLFIVPSLCSMSRAIRASVMMWCWLVWSKMGYRGTTNCLLNW
jgi:acyl-CoA dehydrogenase